MLYSARPWRPRLRGRKADPHRLPRRSRMAVRLERQDMVATIVIDRPEARNAVDGDAARALVAAFRVFEADDGLRVAVLWGAGGTFCAGADLKARGTGRGLGLAPDGDGPMGPTRMAFTEPTIAPGGGYAVAGGLELALMCDLRVADETAIFGVFCRRWGVPLLDGGTVRLPHLIGLSRALDMILTGRPVDAREALTFGLANRVVPAGQAREEAEELARTIAAFPPRCVDSDRRSAWEGMGLSIEAGMQNEFTLGKATRGTVVAQPTLSRDLRVLGLAKTPRGYIVPEAAVQFAPAATRDATLQRAIRTFVVSVQVAGSLVVVRTPPAGAHPVARALDEAG